MSGVSLVQFSNLDLKKLLPSARAALGRSLSEKADSANADPPLHHMLCVAALKEPNLKPTASSLVPYANLFHAGFLVAADERDFAEFLEICGMPALLVDSVQRGTMVAFISGSMSQWRMAVLRGCVPTVTSEVRKICNQLYAEFNKLGLAPMFEARKRENTSDNTFFLEHK